MKGLDYRKLIVEQASKTGADAQEAYAEFLDVARQIREHRDEGVRLQERIEEFYPMFAHYRKGEPYNAPSELLSEEQLKVCYGNLKGRQRFENKCVAILTRRGNRILGAQYLKTTDRSKPKSGERDE
jgi:hypothetical protein